MFIRHTLTPNKEIVSSVHGPYRFIPQLRRSSAAAKVNHGLGRVFGFG